MVTLTTLIILAASRGIRGAGCARSLSLRWRIRWRATPVFDFRNKVVLITGAAQGFGRVCAVAFAERGAKLALCDPNDEGGRETLRLVTEKDAEGLY